MFTLKTTLTPTNRCRYRRASSDSSTKGNLDAENRSNCKQGSSSKPAPSVPPCLPSSLPPSLPVTTSEHLSPISSAPPTLPLLYLQKLKKEQTEMYYPTPPVSPSAVPKSQEQSVASTLPSEENGTGKTWRKKRANSAFASEFRKAQVTIFFRQLFLGIERKNEALTDHACSHMHCMALTYRRLGDWKAVNSESVTSLLFNFECMSKMLVDCVGLPPENPRTAFAEVTNMDSTELSSKFVPHPPDLPKPSSSDNSKRRAGIMKSLQLLNPIRSKSRSSNKRKSKKKDVASNLPVAGFAGQVHKRWIMSP